MKKYKVIVTQMVEIDVDETKFTEAVMEEFRRSFYDFLTVEEHVSHLAQLYARGLINEFNRDHFVEGYGPIKDWSLTFRSVVEDTEVSEV
jgi:hypothetical protein